MQDDQKASTNGEWTSVTWLGGDTPMIRYVNPQEILDERLRDIQQRLQRIEQYIVDNNIVQKKDGGQYGTYTLPENSMAWNTSAPGHEPKSE